MMETELREAIVKEAESWNGTPWHHEGRIKGAGVDCGMMLLEVFEKVGAMSHVAPGHYSQDFMLHNRREWYLETVLQYAYEIYRNPKPGDIILFRNGLTYSHGAIVIEWPRFIHAFAPRRVVCHGVIGQGTMTKKPYRMFRFKDFAANGDDRP